MLDALYLSFFRPSAILSISSETYKVSPSPSPPTSFFPSLLKCPSELLQGSKQSRTKKDALKSCPGLLLAKKCILKQKRGSSKTGLNWTGRFYRCRLPFLIDRRSWVKRVWRTLAKTARSVEKTSGVRKRESEIWENGGGRQPFALPPLQEIFEKEKGGE